MQTNQAVDSLLEKLKDDSVEYKNLNTKKYSLAEKKHAIRSLMNIRMPGTATDDLLKVQDAYLKEELTEKGVVTLADIPTIKEQYNSLFPFAEKLSLWQGDITRLKVGAIVNAANSQMLGCFVPCHRCIDNAIHSAAGIQLRNECAYMMDQRRIRYGRQYEEPTGTAT
ncbi:MAG: macro domain-containing protein, partial [Lachnospiraceae bacterium]|nr:macro domain-containing protein [Lachnospiraceae bacterium]